ncbi:MAG: hypothetical protein AAF089_15535 [Bacteroidota bacterium]
MPPAEASTMPPRRRRPGRPKKADSPKFVGVRLSGADYRKLEEIRRAEGLTLSDAIRWAIDIAYPHRAKH